MFVRSTYFPRFCIRADRIKHVVLTKVDVPTDTGDPAYSLFLHGESGTAFQSEPIIEDPEHIMQTITAELNGKEQRVALVQQYTAMTDEDKNWFMTVVQLTER